MRKLAILWALALAACNTREVPPAALPATVPPPPERFTRPPGFMSFTALGTEPFWSITTGDGVLVYSTPELLEGVRLIAGSGYSGNRSTGEENYSFSAKLNGQTLILRIKRGECSDGMSDTVYAYTATLKIGDRNEQGCAKKL